MAKDRNTMAKRQREYEKRDKAARKREKREKRQAESSTMKPANPDISEGESQVLSIFQRYLMSAGKMLCLSSQEVESHRQSLSRLVEAGLLVTESFRGAYSLTSSGFDVMRKLSREST